MPARGDGQTGMGTFIGGQQDVAQTRRVLVSLLDGDDHRSLGGAHDIDRPAAVVVLQPQLVLHALAVLGAPEPQLLAVVAGLFGNLRIESSYRLLETGRGRTSSRDEGLRLWYVALAVLLVNAYLTLRREASKTFGRGEAGRCWCLELLAALAQLLLETPAAP
jgi:hypothetical protein